MVDMTLFLAARDLKGSKGLLAVRPNQVLLSGEQGQANSLAGTLLKSTYVGHQMEHRISTAFGEVFAVSSDTAEKLSAGQKVSFSFVERGPVLVPAD